MWDCADQPSPTFEWIYLALERAYATAALVVNEYVTECGILYHMHDGSRGASTQGGAMPMLEVTMLDAEDLLDVWVESRFGSDSAELADIAREVAIHECLSASASSFVARFYGHYTESVRSPDLWRAIATSAWLHL